jgi:hypothetical protein
LPTALQALTTDYQVQISCSSDQKTSLKATLADFLTSPIEIGYQTFYPVVERVIQQRERWIVQLVIREMIDA